VDAATLAKLVDAQLTSVRDPEVAKVIGRLRIPPRLEVRPWNFEGASAHPCWIVLEDRATNIGVAYCEYGFGPKTPWGLLWLTGQHLSMGDDSGWFTSLEDAVLDGWELRGRTNRGSQLER
jgi:hypothetical protein